MSYRTLQRRWDGVVILNTMVTISQVTAERVIGTLTNRSPWVAETSRPFNVKRQPNNGFHLGSGSGKKRYMFEKGPRKM